MKKILFLIIFTIFTLIPQKSNAEDLNNSVRAMVGFGEIYNPLSYRIGIGRHDFGILNRDTLGLATYFNNSGFYASFGPAYIIDSSSIGLFGALGKDFTFFNFVYIKAELNTTVTIKNYSAGSGFIGLGIYW